MKALKSHRCFAGLTQFWEHDSQQTRTTMRFSTYIPDGEVRGAIIWLSGLECTEENFMAKSGAQRWLAEEKLMVLCPDTSPRGMQLPGEHERWDFGSGASFYVDATTPGYRDHYRMYSYVSDEIYGLLSAYFNVGERISLMGHSMGGHGALVIGLRESSKFKSVSAFAPIVNPTGCPWGQKAFAGYLGEDLRAWHAYDACELVRAGATHSQRILIDQGLEDSFLKQQLFPDRLVQVCEGRAQKLELRYQPGFDHSYYFIATFIREHIQFHGGHLGG